MSANPNLCGVLDADRPVLTFGIPTWNRADELRTCILRIADQIAACGENVNIFVSDNGSEDATPSVLEELCGRYSFLRSSRRAENAGVDRNILTAMENADGQYFWLFSDDDFLAENALHEVLTIIHSWKPSYIATNFYTCDTEGIPLARQDFQSSMAPRDMASAGLEEIFRGSPLTVGFMSRSIYRRDLLDMEELTKELPHIELWSHLYAIADVVGKRTDAYLSSFYAIGCRVVAARYPTDTLVRRLPNFIDYTLRKFDVSDATRESSIAQIREHYITWLSYIKYRALGPEISPLIYPRFHRFIPTIPKSWVRAALSLKKSLRG